MSFATITVSDKPAVFAAGNVVSFMYDGEFRFVRIEKVRKSSGNIFIGPCTTHITGWDYEADRPVGGYRCFKTEKITALVLVKKVG